MPEREPAVRRRAVAQRVEQEPEARLGLLLAHAEHVEDLLLDLGPVDTDRPAADLDAVEHDVVAARAHRARVLEGAQRRGEGVVQRAPALLGLAPLEHRRVDDPQRAVAALRHEVELAGELQPDLAERGGGDVGLVGHQQQQVADLAGELAGDPLALVVGEELRRRRAPGAVLLHERPYEAAGAEALGVLGQRVQLGARHLARPRVEPADRAAGAEHVLEDLELRRLQHVAEVGHLQPEAHVGLVGAVAEHRLGERHPRPRRRRDLEAGVLEHPAHQPLDRLDHVVLLHEGHLEVELGELGLAEPAQVLVPEAAGDLVVALVAGHHQQLLEQLRRLRQRVPRAQREARRHEEVARALRRGAGQDRRLDVQEVARVEVVADRPDDRVAQDHRLLHRLPAQVEHPVAQAQQLVDVLAVVDRERRGRRLGQALGGRDRQLDLARGDLRVDRALVAADDLAGDGDHVLGAQRAGQRVGLGRGLRMEDELQDAGAVAQVDEDQPAEVAAARHPARDADGLPRPLRVQLAGPRVAVAVRARRSHSAPRMWCITVSASTIFCSPDSMSLSETPSSPKIAT